MDLLNGQRILVLEEQPSIAQLLIDMLAAVNCRVIGPAARVPQALSLLVDRDVDAAILDVKIKGSYSTPVAEELLRRGIPWAFTSSARVDELTSRYPQAPLIIKPFTSGHVMTVLEALLTSVESGRN